jgi:hypothetical protein
MRLVSEMAHTLFCIVAALFILFQTPAYNEPYSGCYARGFSTLVLGCSSWPNFVCGVVFVLFFAIAGPKRTKPHLWGVTVLLIVAAFGGPDAIREGSLIETFDGSGTGLVGWRGPGLALALGGVTAWLLLLSRRIAPKWSRGQV